MAGMFDSTRSLSACNRSRIASGPAWKASTTSAHPPSLLSLHTSAHVEDLWAQAPVHRLLVFPPPPHRAACKLIFACLQAPGTGCSRLTWSCSTKKSADPQVSWLYHCGGYGDYQASAAFASAGYNATWSNLRPSAGVCPARPAAGSSKLLRYGICRAAVLAMVVSLLFCRGWCRIVRRCHGCASDSRTLQPGNSILTFRLGRDFPCV